ncbi:MAG TPA: hypothetical protein V6D22_25810 [Candidatus Obscuribacterales bacterium]
MKVKFEPERLLLKLAILAAGIVIVVGAAAVVFWHEMTKDVPQFTNVPFDATKWKNHADNCGMGDFTRIQMVDDLQSHYHLVGMSRSDLEQLLGPPTKREQHTYLYCLGPQRSWLVETLDWLHLEINNGTVDSVKIGPE